MMMRTPWRLWALTSGEVGAAFSVTDVVNARIRIRVAAEFIKDLRSARSAPLVSS